MKKPLAKPLLQVAENHAITFDLKAAIQAATTDLNSKREAYEQAAIKMSGLLEVAKMLALQNGKVDERVVISRK